MNAWLRNHSFCLLSTLGSTALVGALILGDGPQHGSPMYQARQGSHDGSADVSLRHTQPVAAKRKFHLVEQRPTLHAAQKNARSGAHAAAHGRKVREKKKARDDGISHSRVNRMGVRSSRPAATYSPRDYARAALSDDQFDCFDALIHKESSWNEQASNPETGAYGLVQALPAVKLASAGADWRTNGVTQIRWALEQYIPARYGTPCSAWSHSQATGWY